MSNFCCDDMKYHLEHKCDIHENIFDCADNLFIYNHIMNEYGIIIHDGGSSYIEIKYCPFCGKFLGNSKREEFFELIDKLNLDRDDENFPEEFKSDEWWKKRGL